MVLTEQQHVSAEPEGKPAQVGDKRTTEEASMTSTGSNTATTTSTTEPKQGKHVHKTAKVMPEGDEGEDKVEEEEEEEEEDLSSKKGRGRGRGRGRARGKGRSGAGKKTTATTSKRTKSKSVEHATSSSSSAAAAIESGPTFRDIIEKGRMFFFYRPRVGHDEVHDEADIRRLYIELSPDLYVYPKSSYEATLQTTTQPPMRKKRLLLIPSKHLPDVHSAPHTRHQIHWGFVDMIADTQEEINEYMEGQLYQTKKGNARTLFPARCVGEAMYEIVMHHGTAHLAYVLVDPAEPGEAQKDLNIFKEGSFVLSIKNPTNPTPMHVMHTPYAGFRGLNEEEHSRYSRELQSSFLSKAHPDHQRRFASDKSVPKMLDVLHTEFILIAASDDIVKELSLAGKILEDKAEGMLKREKAAHMSSEAHVRADLHLARPDTQGGNNLHNIDTHPISTKKLE